MLGMQMMIHRGRKVGLHQHVLRHMGAKTYDDLIRAWSKTAGKERLQREFLDKLRGAYSSYFTGSPDYDAIMEVINKGLKGVKKE